MGGTQHTIGNNNTRAYCAFQLALGNMGVSGGGANIFRGHDNVQGATDLGVLSNTLPGYYGLVRRFLEALVTKVWGLDYEWVKGQFDGGSYEQSKGKDVHVMNTKGIPVSRWIDGVLEDKANIAQKDNLKAMFFWGHAPNSQTRGVEQKKAMDGLEMMVIVDPYPTASAVMPDRKDGIYLLPASTQMETYGSVTASNRSFQWRSKVIDPIVRIAAGSHHHVQDWRRSWASKNRCSRTSRSTAKSRWWKMCCAKSTAACGPSVTPARARNA